MAARISASNNQRDRIGSGMANALSRSTNHNVISALRIGNKRGSISRRKTIVVGIIATRPKISLNERGACAKTEALSRIDSTIAVETGVSKIAVACWRLGSVHFRTGRRAKHKATRSRPNMRVRRWAPERVKYQVLVSDSYESQSWDLWSRSVDRPEPRDDRIFADAPVQPHRSRRRSALVVPRCDSDRLLFVLSRCVCRRVFVQRLR